MISRVELMNTIRNSEWDDGMTIFFPKDTCLDTSGNHENRVIEMPTNSEIIGAMKDALKEALDDANKFGMIVDERDVVKCQLPTVVASDEDLDEDLDEDSMSDNYSSEDSDDSYDLGFDDQDNLQVEPHSNTVLLADEDGTMKEIRKSRLVWLLSEPKEKLSTDRRIRVQTTPENNAKRRKTKSSNENPAQTSTLCIRMEEIEVGQWCFFKHIIDDESNDCANILRMVTVGYIVDFKYIKQHSTEQQKYDRQKMRQMHKDFVRTTTSEMIEVLGSWFRCDDTGSLQPIKPKNCLFIPMKNYLGTTLDPIVKQSDSLNKTLVLECDILELKRKLEENLEDNIIEFHKTSNV